MSIITLMTDFGIKDGNVGVMKGVIWGICPAAQISDLSHMIQAQNIREAAYIFARSIPYFPKATINIVVVDPGVGTQRRPMAARIGDWLYVAPDNGTITGLLERAEMQAISWQESDGGPEPKAQKRRARWPYFVGKPCPQCHGQRPSQRRRPVKAVHYPWSLRHCSRCWRRLW